RLRTLALGQRLLTVRVKQLMTYSAQKDKEFRHCSSDSAFALDRPIDRFYTTAPNLFSSGSPSCTDRDDTCQTPPRGLPPSTTSPHRNSWPTIATINRPLVPGAVSSPHAINPDSACCMTWAICAPVTRLISW